MKESYVEFRRIVRKEFAERLKLLRKSKGFTQREIAALLQVDRSAYACYEIGKSQQTISASLANSSLAKHLKVKTGDALLSLTQISFLQDGQAFEYVRSYYVGDRFEFYLENN